MPAPLEVRYTILAGDIRGYHESADPAPGAAHRQARQGPLLHALCQGAGHDIAVSTASIVGVPDPQAPASRTVACRHTHYFAFPGGIAALRGVDWGG